MNLNPTLLDYPCSWQHALMYGSNTPICIAPCDTGGCQETCDVIGNHHTFCKQGGVVNSMGGDRAEGVR